MRSMRNTTLATAMTVLLAAPGYAQPAPGEQETITVRPPYVVTKTTEGGIKDKQTSYTISRVVDYGDLDLKTDSGVSSLNGRVQEAASGVCREMDMRYPDKMFAPAENGNCASNAIARAQPQVTSAIARRRG